MTTVATVFGIIVGGLTVSFVIAVVAGKFIKAGQ